MITELRFHPGRTNMFIDITEKIRPLVREVKDGFAILFTRHTTTALWINEAEKGLINDLKTKMQDLFPTTHYYEHDDFKKRKCPKDERKNGASHLRTTLFQSSLIVPVKNGNLMLGRYQSIFFIELDGPRKERALIVEVCGNAVNLPFAKVY